MKKVLISYVLIPLAMYFTLNQTANARQLAMTLNRHINYHSYILRIQIQQHLYQYSSRHSCILAIPLSW